MPVKANFAGEMIDLKGKSGPPPGPENACWQADIRPAVIETVSLQKVIRAETRDSAGQLLTPAVISTETQQRILSDRSTMWFRSPCPEEMTPEFIATLQRALKARGYYMLPLTGMTDAPTRQAIGRYQRERGLDSDHLSLAAAKDLGLIAGWQSTP